MVKRRANTTAILARELLRTALKNWKQLISIVAISFLALCLFCGLTSNAYRIADRASLVYRDGNYPDVFVTTANLTNRDEIALKNIEGIEEVETRVYAPVSVAGNTAYLVGAEPDSTLSVPDMVKGERGLVITQSMASDQGIGIGGYLNVSIESMLLSGIDIYKPLFDLVVLKDKTNIFREDSIPFKLRVTGIMYHPEGTQNARFSPSIIYADLGYLTDCIIQNIEDNYSVEYLNLFFGSSGMSLETMISSMTYGLKNQALLTCSDPELVSQEVSDYFSSGKTDSILVSAQPGTQNSTYKELDKEQTQSMQLTYVFPLIFFLVSVLIILTTLTQLIIKQRSQIGALKAIGVSRNRLYVHYSVYGALTCAIGSILGFVVGPLLIPRVLAIKYDLLWDLPTVSIRFFTPGSIGMVLAMVILAGICSFLVSWSVIREKPVDTLRPKASHIEKRATKPDSLMSKIPLVIRMAIRNIKRNLGKSFMVVLGMAGCSALLVCGFGIMDTINYDIDRDLNQILRMDVMAVPLDPNPLLEYEIEHIDGVEKVEPLYYLSGTAASNKTSANTDVFLLEEGSKAFGVPIGIDGGISMSEVMAKNLGVSIGDPVTLSINGNVYTRTLTATFKTSIFNQVFGLVSDFSETKFNPTIYAVNLKDGADKDDVSKALDGFDEIAGTRTHDWMEEYAGRLVSTISLMTDVIEIFAVLLSIVVIYNLTSLNITSRHREIATLKVLGFRYHEIRSTLTYEMMIDVIVGTLIGLCFGYPMVMLVMMTNTTELFNFIYHVQWYTYLLAFAISGVTALVVSLVLCLKAKMISMSESLKSVE